jgi:formimidoylglutamase
MTKQLPGDVQQLLLPPTPLSPPIQDPYERSVAELVRPAAEVQGTPLASIFGIPFDTSILGRRGAKSGPGAVRTGLGTFLCYDPNIDVDLAEAPRVADHGDVDVMFTDVDATWERVSKVTEGLVRLGAPIVAIGGDHGLTFPLIRGVANAIQGRLGVISVDGHLDVRVSHHGEKGSGVPFRYMLEELPHKVSGENFTEFGIGGWLNTKLYKDYLDEKRARVITGREIWKGDFDGLVREAIERAADGTDAIYMTFDIDAIEGAVVGGTNSPALGGLHPFEALELVYAFAQHPKALAFDVMEVAPVYDGSGLSERMAGSLILHFLAGRHVAAGAAA